ncbi:hypothetical protein FBUS_00628 [Fasciolopsis buskii]|uniref:Uncharacterized protein n=1 Tax=Fasciolopsis buskii TaxID=27845 RepID=A0A8E0S7E6_9TREM|nr:hypothetical protein FBUS_00628 [Fasciolopsis buski]
MILVTFYYAKYLIILSVVAFAIFGIISMAYVGQCVYCSRFERKFGPFAVQMFGIKKEIHISLVYLIVIPSSVAFGLCWFALRQDPRIGYPLQCILATFIVQFVLSYDFILPSLKQLFILYLLVLPFEIADKIVFPMLNIAGGKSIIETLLSHSLGLEGSSLPGGFRISLAHFSGPENGNCSYLEYNGLLPFAHVLLPGLICALFMLHDCQQQIRFCRNFLASVVGYAIGQVTVHLVRAQSGRVHPALLYLVPCTLIPPLIVALLFGGFGEMRRLWTGQFLDEDHDLDQLREKRISQISVLHVTKEPSVGIY